MEVKIPEWDCTLYIRQLSAKQLAATNGETIGLTLTRCIVDENDELVFTADDADKLFDSNPVAITKLAKAFGELHSAEISKAEVEDIKKK